MMSKARHKKSGGGRTMKVSGNPNVFDETKDMNNTGGRKKGGAVKRATGGSVGVGATKDIGRMAGGAVKARMDRPGRKKGGRVGANNSPLSTAHGTCAAPSAPNANGGN